MSLLSLRFCGAEHRLVRCKSLRRLRKSVLEAFHNIFNNARRAVGLPHPELLGKRQLSNLTGLTAKQIVLTLTNLCPSTHLQCVFQPLSVYHATCTTLRLLFHVCP